MSAAYNASEIDDLSGDKMPELRIIEGPAHQAEGSDVILFDSSCNPPHLAHYNNVISSVVEYVRNNAKIPHIVLSFSMKNADKDHNEKSYSQRIEMMRIMKADLDNILKTEYGYDVVHTSVAITRFAKFFEKEAALRHHFITEERSSILFIVGFDTIIRILDPKYYAPATLTDAMNDFFMRNEFYCIARGHGALKDQLQYLSDIESGKFEPIIPVRWASRIHLLKSETKYQDISSSYIRKILIEGRGNEDATKLVESLVSPRMLNYIKNVYTTP